MTEQNLQYAMTGIGVSSYKNKWIRLPEDVTIVAISNDVNYYPSADDAYYFDTTNEQLFIVQHVSDSDDLIGKTSVQDTDKKLITYRFESVYAFICSAKQGPQCEFYDRIY